MGEGEVCEERGELDKASMNDKLKFHGTITSVQPRIRLLRSFDQRSHSYLGYVLRIDGTVNNEKKKFRIAVGKGANEKYQFQIGQTLNGECLPVADPRLEPAEYYKVSGLKVIIFNEKSNANPPPWHGIPDTLEVYRKRGHRRLATITYEKSCTSCIWGCKMPVEMIIDQWNPSNKGYRFETFCYGPKSCSVYKAGPTRKVPGRKGMVWEEEDWVDEQETEHRDLDE